MRDNILYPVNYVEPAPEPPPPDDAAHGRDKVWVRTALDIAVPEGGTPLSIEQLLELFCGTPWPLDLPKLTVVGNAALALAEVQKPRPLREYVLEGPARVSSLRRSEVREIILEEIAERSPTWTPLEPIE